MTDTSASPRRALSRHILSPALIVAGLLLVAGNLRAALTTVGPLLPVMEEDLGLASVAASILVSLPLLAFAVVSPISPWLSRRFGLERTIAAALLVLAVGLVLRSTPPLTLLWIGTALIGVAIAILNVLLPALVKRDFPTRIGALTGAYSSVQSIFAAVAAGVAVPVAGLSALGWRLPLAMWAGLALIALGVLIPQVLHPASTKVPVAGSELPEPAGPRSPWGRALAWQVTAYMGLQSVVFYVLITWLPSIETSAGISDSEAGVHLFVLNASGIIGSLGCSAVMSRLRDQRVLGVIVPILLLLGSGGFLLAPQAAVLWACVAGIGGGASIVLALSLFGLRTANHSDAASLSGMAQSVGYLLAAAGPIVAGALHDLSDSWAPALIGLVIIEVSLLAFGYLSGRNRVLHVDA